MCGACGRRNKGTSLGCWWGKVEEKISLEDLDVDGRMCTIAIWSRTILVGGVL